MQFINNHILTIVAFFPAIAALGLLFVPGEKKRLLHCLGFGIAAIEFVLSLHLYDHFQPAGLSSFQYVENRLWIPAWNVAYFMGIDGVSLLLILLTTVLTPLALLGSFSSITGRVKEFVIAMLVLETGMIGVFCALDLFLLYVFWEVMLIPMYLLIGILGGKRKIYAALKFFIYTMAGSVLMLVAILYLYFQAGQTFSLLDLYEFRLAPTAQLWVFLAFALAFAIKVPMVPFHTWLPDAHVEAPTAGSVILAGVLLKMGTYGFFRFAMPLFPEAIEVAQPWLIVIAVIGIVYGALVAMVQPDIKKLIAYSSVSHLGVVMLGLFALEPTAVAGGLYQMLNHGVSTGALFLLVGVIYERTHSRAIAEHGGLAKLTPWYATIFVIVTLSSIGVPLTNGFVGEFLSLAGAFQTQRWAAIIGTTGVILSAIYMLWLVERVFFGPVKIPVGANGRSPLQIPDLNWREVGLFVPILILIVWMGVYPKPFLSKMERPIADLMEQMEIYGNDQIPNSKFQTNSNFQNPKRRNARLEF
ncbi:MAG: NADH-quinone oxidoreductase subunit M [Deltaproteobacteria bacterium]|nr:NADH-quinone oxidoreductase subunit M [Deltaproteobacteria bacterium]